MGTVTRFPQERVDYSFPPEALVGATILILPIIRVEREWPLAEGPLLLNDETYKAMVRSFDELHEALKVPPL